VYGHRGVRDLKAGASGAASLRPVHTEIALSANRARAVKLNDGLLDQGGIRGSILSDDGGMRVLNLLINGQLVITLVRMICRIPRRHLRRRGKHDQAVRHELVDATRSIASTALAMLFMHCFVREDAATGFRNTDGTPTDFMPRLAVLARSLAAAVRMPVELPRLLLKRLPLKMAPQRVRRGRCVSSARAFSR